MSRPRADRNRQKRVFRCKDCGFTNGDVLVLRIHVNDEHMKPPPKSYTCPEWFANPDNNLIFFKCGKKFQSFVYLREHRVMDHCSTLHKPCNANIIALTTPKILPFKLTKWEQQVVENAKAVGFENSHNVIERTKYLRDKAQLAAAQYELDGNYDYDQHITYDNPQDTSAQAPIMIPWNECAVVLEDWHYLYNTKSASNSCFVA